jgi:hypothetical protein
MRYSIGLILMLALALGFGACAEEGNGGEDADVAGDWEMSSTVVTDNCDGRMSQTFLMTITQEGSNLTVETPEVTFSGTVSGNRIQMNGSFPEDNGTVTVNATLVVSGDGNSMEGSDNWTWTDGSSSCSGSDSLRATRIADCIDNVCPCTEAGIRIAIAKGGGLFTFDCAGPKTVETDAEIVIDQDVMLDGQGDLTIDGGGIHPVFIVEQPVMAELHGFIITNGAAIEGAGVYNRGDLTIEDSTVRGNTAEISAGIRNEGVLKVANSTVSGNRNTGAPDGAGIHNGSSGGVSLTNSTVSENAGEGIRNEGALDLANSTVSGNAESGIVNDAGASLTLRNTLVDGGCDDQGDAVSLGHNIESPGSSCGLDPNGTDLDNVPAEQLNLQPLADNGGPTMTHALGTGSIAIDSIPEADCVGPDGEPLTTDQRGEPRPAGAECDVGAFEVQP